MQKLKWIIAIAVFLVIILAGLLTLGSVAPGNFPAGTELTIVKGSTLTQAANLLLEKGIVKSPFIFKVYASILDKTGVKTGSYVFKEPISALRVAYRLVRGETGYDLVKVTIPEGSDTHDMAAIIAKSVPKFDKELFVNLAKKKEGYLFPDTYFWRTNTTAEEVIADMGRVFEQKIATIQDDLVESDRSFEDIMIMASLVEREANNSKDRKIVAGILWKRLDNEVALQVDATFHYLLGKASADLTVDDLAMNSPYNLYINRGLPPRPIASPGLQTILDTIEYTKTSYWYYLSSDDGTMHYADDLDGHVENKRKYLN